jgi:hypothetical protein
MTEKYYKLEFYIPEDHAESVKQAVFAAGAGKLGNYDYCCWTTAGKGQFKPCAGSNPFIGQQDTVEYVTELKIEIICAAEYIEAVIEALKKAHPYETPAYQYWAVNI